MNKLNNNPNQYYDIIRKYQEAQILFSAIRLNIFSYLDIQSSVEDIAKKLKYDIRKTELLLLTLASCGWIQKNNNLYLNTVSTKKILSQNSELYLGETILFREKMTSLNNLEEKMFSKNNIVSDTYDFEELARVSIPEMYAGRVWAFIDIVKKIYPNQGEGFKILDLGGGAGILAIEFIKNFPKSTATVFETREVVNFTKKIIKENSAEDNVRVLCGDFNLDDLGGTYDLIIASGILNFVNRDISSFIEKLSSSIVDEGYLLVVGKFSEHKYDIPLNMVSWLSGFLDGIPLPPCNDVLNIAMKNEGLQIIEEINDTMFYGQLYRKGKKISI